MTPKNLIVFDFDHTVIDDNSDTAIMKLIKPKNIPKEIKDLHRSDGWTAFMQGIFKILHQNNISECAITNLIRKLLPVSGMTELISELHDNLDYDVIILSDSNSFFIKHWLEENKLDSKILKTFTNPAHFENGMLLIQMYHFQDTCHLSTKNLCKGQIMEGFIKQQAEVGVTYNKIVYVGDGYNDFCPIERLREKDLACVREKYKCADLVKRAKEGGYVDDKGVRHVVKADVLVWSNGFDILHYINENN